MISLSRVVVSVAALVLILAVRPTAAQDVDNGESSLRSTAQHRTQYVPLDVILTYIAPDASAPGDPAVRLATLA